MLVLTDGVKTNVFLSGRNLPNVHVMPYADVSTYHILWSDVVLIEGGAIGHTLPPIKEESLPLPPRRATPAVTPAVSGRKAAANKKAAAKAPAAKKTAAKKAAKRAAKAETKSAAAKKPAAKKSAAKKAPKKKDGKSWPLYIAPSCVRCDREDVDRPPGARRVRVRGCARRVEAGDSPGDRAAVRGQGDWVWTSNQRGKLRGRQVGGPSPGGRRRLSRSVGDTIEGIFEG